MQPIPAYPVLHAVQPDDSILQDLLQQVNRRHFDGRVDTDICWQVPEAIITEHVRLQDGSRHTLHRVPACACPTVLGGIQMHPFLAHRKAPRFVLHYLIYLQCCSLLDRYRSEDHLAQRLAAAPFAEKSQRWLKKEGFPESLAQCSDEAFTTLH